MSVFPLKRPSMILSERKKVIIAGGDYCTVGLKADGTVVATNSTNVSGWRNIVAVACGWKHSVGLKADGTVVAVGNSYGHHNVTGWSNIVSVACGVQHTVGLKSDGTVVAVGDNTYGQRNVQSWKLARYDKKGLLIAKTPINLLDKTRVKGFTIAGIQPANTNRRVAFKVDNNWNKLSTDGALSPSQRQEEIGRASCRERV